MGRKTHPNLSPYIFVLYMERLGHGIHNAVRDGSWKPIHLSRRGTPLTHLFFANDLLLLAEATCNQAKTINEILEIQFQEGKSMRKKRKSFSPGM